MVRAAHRALVARHVVDAASNASPFAVARAFRHLANPRRTQARALRVDLTAVASLTRSAARRVTGCEAAKSTVAIDIVTTALQTDAFARIGIPRGHAVTAGGDDKDPHHTHLHEQYKHHAMRK